MEVSIITCMLALALTMGEPVRSQTAPTEQTVPIGGIVTLLCPFVPDDLWIWVYWKKDDRTIYSLEVKSNTPWTSDKRYEGSNHATRLTIKDLKKTDSGIYRCKVATLISIKERGQVLLSVTEQEEGLSTTSSDVLSTIFTTVPPPHAEYNKIFLAFSISIFIISIIINIIMCRVSKYRECFKDSRFVGTSIILERRTSLSLDTHCRYDVGGRPEENSNASKSSTSETGESQLPLVGPLLIDDLCRASASNTNHPVVKRMRKVVHSLVELYKGEDAPLKDGRYSESLKKYVSSVPNDVLGDVEYFLDKLDHIPVGRKRDVCEIMLIMPEIQEGGTSRSYSNKDIFLEYGQKDHTSAVKDELKSRTTILKGQMRSILIESETREAARNYISLIILYAPVQKSESASFSHQTASTFNQSANKTEQETSFLSQREDSERDDDKLIEFWLSKVLKLDPTVQERIVEQFDEFDPDAESSFMKPQPLGSLWPLKTNFNLLSREQLISILQESCAPTSYNQAFAEASHLTDTMERTTKKEI